MRLYSGLLFTLALSAVAGQAYGGAWTQEQGRGQIILTGLHYAADERWDNQGRRQAQADYGKYELNPYMEYGLADGLTLGANLSLLRAQQDGAAGNSTRTSWGIGDSEFFLRKRLLEYNGFVAASESVIKLPSPHSSEPRLGSTHPDAGTGFSFGYGFSAGGQNHFANLDTQYRYRFGSQKDQVKLAASTGIGITGKWMVMPQAFLTYRVARPTAASFTQSPADDYNLVRLQLSAVYKITEDLSIQFGGFRDVSGKNAGVGTGALLSLWKKI